MKRNLTIVMLLLTMLFIGCSKENEEVEGVNTKFEVVICNDMDLTRTHPSVSDGILYSVTLGTTQGELIEIGNVQNGKRVSYTLKDKYSKDDSFILFMKYLPSSGGSLNNQGYMLMYAGSDPALFPLKENKPTEVHISENTSFMTSRYTKKSDLMNILQAAGL